MNQLQLISKHRSLLMGVGIIFIMLYHSRSFSTLDYASIPVLNFISQISYGGVDVFLFLSGFGLYYSSLKNESKKQYYLKRFIRIYPAYIVALLLNNLLQGDYSVANFFTELFALDIWISNTVPFWYVSSLIPLYLIFPFYIKLFMRSPYWVTLAMVIFGFVVSTLFLKSGADTWLTILFLTRIPIFFIGVLFGKLSTDKDLDTSKIKIGLYILTVIGFISLYIFINHHLFARYLWKGLFWYPFIFIVPGFCLFLSEMFDKYITEKKVRNFFLFFGKISYELYLMHAMLFVFINSLSAEYNLNMWLVALILALMSIIGGYILNKGTDRVASLIKK